VDCRVSDGSRVMGADVVELERLFKERFSDVGLPPLPQFGKDGIESGIYRNSIGKGSARLPQSLGLARS
jgi:hypothetical protein